MQKGGSKKVAQASRLCSPSHAENGARPRAPPGRRVSPDPTRRPCEAEYRFARRLPLLAHRHKASRLAGSGWRRSPGGASPETSGKALPSGIRPPVRFVRWSPLSFRSGFDQSDPILRSHFRILHSPRGQPRAPPGRGISPSSFPCSEHQDFILLRQESVRYGSLHARNGGVSKWYVLALSGSLVPPKWYRESGVRCPAPEGARRPLHRTLCSSSVGAPPVPPLRRTESPLPLRCCRKGSLCPCGMVSRRAGHRPKRALAGLGRPIPLNLNFRVRWSLNPGPHH